MRIKSLLTFALLLSAAITLSVSGHAQTVTRAKTHDKAEVAESRLQVGAAQFNEYLPLLEGKRVSLVVNQSSIIESPIIKGSAVINSSPEPTHLVDALLNRDINVVSIMSPEHGFRGKAGAGEKIDNDVDVKTGLPIHSLYGKTKKPTADMLANTDILVFDIQDVGVRFYTYLSTLHYVLEAAAEAHIPVIVLDRPNPNGAFTDGPILQSDYASFVGMHAIPVLHGMTLGELALMIVGEQWMTTDAIEGKQLAQQVNKHMQSQALLTVIPVANYYKQMPYSLPVAPSPNLPNDAAIALYPTLCFFEGTDVSVGRGTNLPFQLIGHPVIALGDENIDVVANQAAPSPKHNNTTLKASFMTDAPISGLNIDVLLDAYAQFNEQDITFFTRPDFFDKLAGTDSLRQAIIAGKTSTQIQASWAEGLATFKQLRSPYLLYQLMASELPDDVKSRVKTINMKVATHYE
ncbi:MULTISPECIES: exo-beta-N-acetylmuramidase NamZ family protein [Alteromonas]|uniref:DUF1343 domain-containing protein n=1 Tax=Alteromonas stellipolaris TaxID=233316 RepID=A0AAW7Z5Y7_9ALTE|nr:MULTISPECIES: DUF1343 domain-containing protein [Alteromonas]AMJ89446.1 hypothetical protein AV940_02550 [Alteromonas sp. Mac2]ALM92018.1 hypothetical protein AOR13_3014 [Alteromonas stellipolaris LMG 21856]AMJ73161.1 hypothetical protein AVL57_03710 [Alteromonas stellipolaris]AMJ85553.1 hypothetical protein AV939_02525 [Alteromonas sp. Mac1]ANB20190.1 hypothetical protein A6K25_02145 [Alteromonas stellipolaris]